MITREQSFQFMKALAKGTWNHLPAMLAAIPATSVAGKLLAEIKMIGEEAIKAGHSPESQSETINQLIDNCGGEAEFKKQLREELKAERTPENPVYINCAIFLIGKTDLLSKQEQDKLVDTLKGEVSPETVEIASFLDAFKEDYFGGDYESCDNAIEIGEKFIAFNFDDMADHPYDEDDLKTIMEMMNKIVGREVFIDYEGDGTDDPCIY